MKHNIHYRTHGGRIAAPNKSRQIHIVEEFMPAIAPSTKSIPEKLQMKAGRSVLVVNAPAGYDRLMGKLPAGVQIAGAGQKPVDVIQIFVQTKKDLERELLRLKSVVNPKGMIWVTYPKGTSKIRSEINRDSIAAYAETIGLEGVAIAAIDNDWSALRLKVVS